MLSITSHEYLQKAEVLVDSWILRILKTVFVELLWLYCSSFCARLVNFSEIQVISIITDLKKSEMSTDFSQLNCQKTKFEVYLNWHLCFLLCFSIIAVIHKTHLSFLLHFTALQFWYSEKFSFIINIRIIPQIHMITENSFVSCKCHHETFVTTHHTRQKVRWW